MFLCLVKMNNIQHMADISTLNCWHKHVGIHYNKYRVSQNLSRSDYPPFYMSDNWSLVFLSELMGKLHKYAKGSHQKKKTAYFVTST